MSKRTLISGISGQDGPYLEKILLSKECGRHGTARDAQRKLRQFCVDSRGPNSCWLYGQQEITPACDVPVLVSVVTNGTP